MACANNLTEDTQRRTQYLVSYHKGKKQKCNARQKFVSLTPVLLPFELVSDRR